MSIHHVALFDKPGFHCKSDHSSSARHLALSVLIALAVFVAFAPLANAQFNGNIQGVILDPSGAAVPSATVVLTNADTGIASETRSTDSGNYRFSSLGPGSYSVKVTAAGFETTEVHVTLQTSQTQGVNITVKVGASRQSITVTGAAPILDVDENRVQTTIPSEQVVGLPQLNRNTWDTLTVAPGVSGSGTRGPGESPGGGADNFGTQTPALSANGRSYTGNLVMVDGMNVTSPIQNGNIILSPIQDSVQEVSIQANSWDAESALGSSILVQVTTKSGTNKFHGTGALFYTNQDLIAKQEFSGGFTPFSRKDLSATLGGPIFKNKTFFFADFEKLWSTVAASLSGTQTWEAPEFSAWAQSTFPNSVGTTVLKDYPIKFGKSAGTFKTAQEYFGSSCGTPATYNIPCGTPVLDSGTFQASPYYNALQYNFRLDHYFTSSDRFYIAYYNDSFEQEQPAIRPGLVVLNLMSNRYGQADYTHIFNPRLLAEGAFAFASVGGANGQNGDLKVPNINVTGQSEGITSGGWGPGAYRGPEYNWRAVLSAVSGRHNLKFGANGVHAIEHGDFTPVSVRPTFQFNNLLDLVTDSAFSESGVSLDPATGNAGKVVFGGQENPFGFFVQDDWKAKPNLSLTLALRWDNFTNHTPWGNSGFQFANIILGSGNTFDQQIASATVPKVSGVFADSISNLWSPRIGFSWDPSHKGKWSVRGGIGVFHDWVTLGQSVDQMRLNPPSLITPTFSVQTPSLPPPLFALAPSGTYPFGFPLPQLTEEQLASLGGGIASVVGMDRHFKAPLAVNYVAGAEHQMWQHYVFGASYSGSQGYDQLNGTDRNRFNGSLAQNNGTLVRLNPTYGSMNYVTNSNSSSYHAMILTFRGTPGAHAQFQGSYLLSHVQNYPEAGTRFDQDIGFNIPDPHAYFNYRGDANWDVRHRFSFSGSYTIPGMQSGFGKVLTSGWQVASLMALQSGTPFWVFNTLPYKGFTQGGSTFSEGDFNADGVSWDIPNTPARNSKFTGSHSRSDYTNGLFTRNDFECTAPSASTCQPGSGGQPGVVLDLLPAVGTEGSLKRNLYRNPGMAQVDASLMKNNPFSLWGSETNLQFRFDFLNVLNHVNLGSVDANMADGTFGKVTSALASRQLQLGVRIAF